MKKVLLLFLTILLVTLLVGCNKEAELKPLFKPEEIDTFEVLNEEQTQSFIKNVIKNIPETMKVAINIKVKLETPKVTETKLIAEINISKECDLMYVRYIDMKIKITSSEQERNMKITGDNYYEEGKSYTRIIGQSKFEENETKFEMDFEIKNKSNHQDIFIIGINILDIKNSVEKAINIKKSKDDKFYCAESALSQYMIFDENFKLKQIIIKVGAIETIYEVIKENVKIPKLTEKQKNTYKEGDIKIPGLD